MGNKKENEMEPVVEAVPEEKDLISSDDVLAVVSGDHIALIEQLERAKQVALEQLQSSKNSSTAVNQKQLEEELRKREEELAAAKRVQEEMRRKEELARQEAERKRLAAEEEARQRKLAAEAEAKRKAEEERQRQLQIEEEQRKKLEAQQLEEQKRIAHEQEIARKKQEKEAAIQQAKLEKEQKKLAKQEAIKQRKLAKEEAKKQRKLERMNKHNKQEPTENVITPIPAIPPISSSIPPVVVPPQQVPVGTQPTTTEAVKPVSAAAPAMQPAPQQPVTNTNAVVEPVATNAVPVQKQEEKPTPTTTVKTEQQTTVPVTNNSTSQPEKPEEPEGPKSNFKYWMALILFICLLFIVIFLPQISEMISKYQDQKKLEQEAIITTGNLKCKLSKSDDKYDHQYVTSFAFRDSKMYKFTYTSTIKGDRNEDVLELTEMRKTCDILKEQTEKIDGIDVSCGLSNGVYTNEQVLKYDILDTEKVTTAYLEAGGTYPNYTYQQNIDEIEKQMKASGYTCVRER